MGLSQAGIVFLRIIWYSYSALLLSRFSAITSGVLHEIYKTGSNEPAFEIFLFRRTQQWLPGTIMFKEPAPFPPGPTPSTTVKRMK
jgi:hypothetical protein